MAKRKKSTKKNAPPQLEQQQPLESIDSSDEILLQSTDKATAFVAIHQNNLLQSSSAPDVNEAFSQDSQSHHSSVKDNDHESKLLDAISKVDPDYAPHLQHHHHIKEHHEFVTSQDPPHVYYVGGDEDLMDDEDESESAKLYNKDGEEEEIQAVDVTKRYERKQSLKQRLKNFSIRDIIVKWRYSIVYSLYLLFMSALAAFLFGWSIYKRGKIEEIWFLALEGLCTFAICYECVLSIFLYRRQFYKKLIVWCNLFVSLSAIIIFSLLLYCFIEKEENYFWNNVAFAQEAVIGLHCCVNAFRIIIYILQIRRGGGIVRNNVIVLDVSSNDISASPTAAHLAETTEHRYGTSQV